MSYCYCLILISLIPILFSPVLCWLGRYRLIVGSPTGQQPTTDVLLLAKYDNIRKYHLENVIKKCLQNKPDKDKHNRASRNTFIFQTTVNFIIAITSKLMKEEISKSFREAGIYSVRINSTQDITSTDKCSVILGFVRENVEKRLLDLLTVNRQLEQTCAIC